MKKLTLFAALSLSLVLAACRSDKPQTAQEEVAAPAESTPPAEDGNQEVPYVQSELGNLVGVYVDRSYPDKGFWKKVTISGVAGDKVTVEFTGKPVNGKPGCQFRSIGDFRNGRIEVKMENKEGLAEEAYTRMLLQLKEDGTLEVRAKGSKEDVQSVLTLFCVVNTSLGDIYQRLQE